MFFYAIIFLFVFLAALVFLWKRTGNKGGDTPDSDQEISVSGGAGEKDPSMPSKEENRAHIKAHEARIVNDVDLMLAALTEEADPVERHLLYRDIIAQTFPKRHQDPQARRMFMQAAEAHLREMPPIIAQLTERFGSKPYFFTFSYYAIALSEQMEFDKAMEICRQAQAYGVKDGLGVGFEKRIQQIQRRRQRMESNQAA